MTLVEFVATNVLCDGHDWRLIDEKRELRAATDEEKAAHEARLGAFRGSGAAVTALDPLRVPTGATVRRWYCTRCRRVESTVP